MNKPISSAAAVIDGLAVVNDSYLRIADPNGNLSNRKGFLWRASVDDAAGLGAGHGRWGWAQIVTLGETRVAGGVTQVYQFGSADAGWFTTGLDSSMPFPSTAGDASDGLFSADNTPFDTNDAPGSALNSATETSHSRQDGFTDYLMYLPPGDGSQFVPLQSFA